MDTPRPDHLDLDCGIAYDRMATWLDDEMGLPRSSGEWLYAHAGGSCRIALERLEDRAFRHLSIERTRLVAEGDPRALASFYKLFTLRFISAGG